MNIGLIVQVRLNSSRLPKKVLTKINGIPLLEYLLFRLKKSFDRSQILIATSNEHQDNPIHQYCINNNFFFFRGSLEDVAKRMLDAAKHIKAKTFVRINGDSPIIDPKIISQAIEIFQSGNYDLVTNIFPRSFPIGQSVEVIRTSTFEKAYKKMSTTDHFEHVTKYYYDYPEIFQIKNFINDRDLSKYRLVVDTPEDLERMKRIIDSMTKPYSEYSMDELIEIYPSA